MGKTFRPRRHIVINIGGEYGSGGPEIGRIVASDLGIEYYDRDLIDTISKESEEEGLATAHAGDGAGVRLGFEASLDAQEGDPALGDIYAQFDVIRRMAAHSCVIVGRCGNYILEGVEDCVNVFVYAPEELRLQAVMNGERLSKRKALETLRDRDRQLHDRYRYITGANRGDRRYRDLMVDSSVLGWARTAQLIESFAEMARDAG